MWELEVERGELAYAFRRFQPPFYSFLYSVHSELPNLLINTHTATERSDMLAYVARLRALPSVLDVAIEQSRVSAREGIRAPRFQYERVISGSRQLLTGAPLDDSQRDSPLWADANTKIAKLEAAGTVTPAAAAALLGEVRTALRALQPAYERVIAWAEGDIGEAPSGRAGAASLPDGLEWYAAALKLNTTTDVTPDEVHARGQSPAERFQSHGIDPRQWLSILRRWQRLRCPLVSRRPRSMLRRS